MKKGDVYRHYKGGIYMYIGIASTVEPEVVPNFRCYTQAKHSETEKIVNVSQVMEDVYVSDAKEPVVLYKSSKDGQLWARPVHLFFDHKVVAKPSDVFPDPVIKHVKRFTKIT